MEKEVVGSGEMLGGFMMRSLALVRCSKPCQDERSHQGSARDDCERERQLRRTSSHVESAPTPYGD